jgi:hypothetical protein
MKNFIAVVAGLAAGMCIISIIELISSSVYPLPAELDFKNKNSLKDYIENVPSGSLLFVLTGWALGSFAGGLVSSLISENKKIKCALITGAILFMTGLINLITLPHPLWFWIAGLSVYFPFAYAGGKLGIKLKTTKSVSS